jgi:hypothetical protein
MVGHAKTTHTVTRPLLGGRVTRLEGHGYMPKITLRAQLYRTPDKYVSDGTYSPAGTVSYRHQVSIEGAAALMYHDEDLTARDLNGSRELLDQGEGVPVEAVIDLYVAKSGKLTPKLLELREL